MSYFKGVFTCSKRLPFPACHPLTGTVSLEINAEDLDLALSAHQLLSCCHFIVLMTTAAADRVLSAAANYNMGILSVVAN